MTKRRLIALSVFCGLFLLGSGFVGGAWAVGKLIEVPAPAPTCDRPEVNRDNVMIKLNEYRLANDKKSMARDSTLDTYAQLRAEELAASNTFTHETKYGNYITWAEKNDPKKEYLAFDRLNGEILFKGAKTPCYAVSGWASSPTHHEIMLLGDDDNEVMGIGIKDDIIAVEIAHEKNL